MDVFVVTYVLRDNPTGTKTLFRWASCIKRAKELSISLSRRNPMHLFECKKYTVTAYDNRYVNIDGNLVRKIKSIDFETR